MLENCGVVVLGVAAWVGIVRYGLFDTRVVVNRALVYGLLTLAVVAVYAGVAALVGLAQTLPVALAERRRLPAHVEEAVRVLERAEAAGWDGAGA